MPAVKKSNDSSLHSKAPRIAGFRLMEILHQGSSGNMYKARQERLGRMVALKLLAEWPPPADIALQRFNRAAYVLAQVPHPNLVTLYDSGTIDSFHYASLEYLEGQTLQRRLAVAGLADEGLAVSMAAQVLRALAAMHARGICHRNVKTKNIFLEPDGKLHLIGLGLANCQPAFFSPQLDARPVGTPHFMAPEVIRGSYADPRSDLYSLGVTLYVAVTGTTPFAQGSPLAVLSRQLTEQAGDLAKAQPGLSPQFVTFVETLMAQDVDRRFQSAQAALEAGEELERRHHVGPQQPAAPADEAPLPTPRQRASIPPPPRRGKLAAPWLIAPAAVLGTVLLLLGLWWLTAGRHKPDSSVPAPAKPESSAAPAEAAPAEPTPAAPGPAEGAEKAEFERLLDLDDTFRAKPAAGADAWSSYLQNFPATPASRRQVARRMLDSYLNLDEARHKAKPAAKE